MVRLLAAAVEECAYDGGQTGAAKDGAGYRAFFENAKDAAANGGNADEEGGKDSAPAQESFDRLFAPFNGLAVAGLGFCHAKDAVSGARKNLLETLEVLRVRKRPLVGFQALRGDRALNGLLGRWVLWHWSR